MKVETDGRNPSLTQFVLRGVAFLLVLAVIFVLLFMRYRGDFTSTVDVSAELTDVGDGLVDGADVRYNGFIVGSVKSVGLSGDTTPEGQSIKDVAVEILPAQAEGIPSNVTARTVPSNLFGVNSVEFVPPADPASDRLTSGDVVPADTSLDTIKLQDAQNQLRTLLQAVPPAELADVLATVSDALKGGGRVFGMFVPILNTYWQSINAEFPPGAPSGFDNFNRSVRGLSQSAPQLLDTLGRSVIPAMTIAEKRDDLTALLSAAQGVTDEVQALFAKNGDLGKRVTGDANRMLGATVLEPQSLPQALTALNNLAARVLTVFTGTNGHAKLNVGISFGAYQRYTRQNCPVYDGGPYGQLRGPGCVGPGTGTGPTSSGPLAVYPSDGMRRMSPAGMVTTGADNKTLQTALNRQPGAADTLMLGPLVQAATPRPAGDTAPAGGAANGEGGGR